MAGGALEPLVYTIDETAFLLKVSPRTIRNLLRRGELVRRKVGARTVIPKTSVEGFVRRDHPTRDYRKPGGKGCL